MYNIKVLYVTFIYNIKVLYKSEFHLSGKNLK